MVLGMGGGNSVEVEVEAEGTGAFARDMRGAQSSLGGLRTSAIAAGAALTGIGIAGAAGIGATVSQAADLETAMSEVTTLMGEGEDAAVQYGDEVERLSTEFAAQGGQVEVTQALYQTLSAGIADAGDETQFLETSMRAAQAGLTDTEVAVDSLSTVVNAYNLEADEASRVSDVLFETVRQGKTRFEDLGSTVGRVVPTAAEMGVEIEQVGAALATLTANGQSTDQAVTAVNRTLTSLLKPTGDAAAVINDMGYESGRALVEAEGFAGALDTINEHTEATDAEMTDVFNNVRALRGVLPLAGESSEQFAENLAAMQNSAGATDRAFAEMSDTAEFTFQQAMNELESVAITLGEAFLDELAPTLHTLAETLGDVADYFNSLSDETRSFIAQGVIAGTAFSLIAGAAILAVTAISAVSGVILPVVGILAGVAAAAGALYAAWETNFAGIRDVVEDTFAGLREVWDTHAGPLRADVAAFLDALNAFWDEWGDEIAFVVNGLLQYLSRVFVTAIDGAFTAVRVLLSVLQGDFEGAFAEITSFVDRYIGRVNELLSAWGLDAEIGATGEDAMQAFSDALAPAVTLWNQHVAPVVDEANAAFRAIVDAVRRNLDIFTGVLSRHFGRVRELWRVHAGPLVREVRETLQPLITISRVVLGLFLGLIRTYLGAVQAVWTRWGDEILATLGFVFDAISVTVVTAMDALLTAIRVALNLLQGDWKEAWDAIAGFAERTINRVSGFIDSWDPIAAIMDAASGIGNALLDAINDALGLPFEHTVGRVEVQGEEVFAGETIRIPALAEGGVVTEPTQALVGEAGPEAVVPLDRLGEFTGDGNGAARGGSGTVVEVVVENMDLRGQSNPERAGREAGRGLRDEMQAVNIPDTHL